MRTPDPPHHDELPTALTERDQWVCWRTTERDGTKTKLPVDASTGRLASATDPTTWTSFTQARQAALDDHAIAGVGFVFTDDDPLVGVDLDSCRDDQTGTLPGERNRRGDVELYETTRFFTVTGTHLDATPTEVHERTPELTAVYDEHIQESETTPESTAEEPETNGATPATEHTQSGDLSADTETETNTDLSDDELLTHAQSAANAEKFERLFAGTTSGYESHSEADFALCSMLAFWSGGDPAQMDRLVRRSGLYRPKWDEVHFGDGSTYGEKTIKRAIAGTTEYYSPTEPRSAETSETTPSENTTEHVLTDEQRQRIETRDRVRRRTIDRLETEVDTLTTERDQLEAQLRDERTRRRRLAQQLEEHSTRDRSLWERFVARIRW